MVESKRVKEYCSVTQAKDVTRKMSVVTGGETVVSGESVTGRVKVMKKGRTGV